MFRVLPANCSRLQHAAFCVLNPDLLRKDDLISKFEKNDFPKVIMYIYFYFFLNHNVLFFIDFVNGFDLKTAAGLNFSERSLLFFLFEGNKKNV